ncbi:hypothetical protein CY0110_19487 [Crocosphaera chwakensis CCY0110]|uniref:Uncharacterized protein n=1 Tax=Crocosphaera chwakensis CCY0110 TaxID=391612 RepID=A3IJM9_9CHRO|nr:hypothetical protein CY0110_19487 [Crocosphaera chwakensis CCY0110]
MTDNHFNVFIRDINSLGLINTLDLID